MDTELYPLSSVHECAVEVCKRKLDEEKKEWDRLLVEYKALEHTNPILLSLCRTVMQSMDLFPRVDFLSAEESIFVHGLKSCIRYVRRFLEVHRAFADRACRVFRGSDGCAWIACNFLQVLLNEIHDALEQSKTAASVDVDDQIIFKSIDGNPISVSRVTLQKMVVERVTIWFEICERFRWTDAVIDMIEPGIPGVNETAETTENDDDKNDLSFEVFAQLERTFSMFWIHSHPSNVDMVFREFGTHKIGVLNMCISNADAKGVELCLATSKDLKALNQCRPFCQLLGETQDRRTQRFQDPQHDVIFHMLLRCATVDGEGLNPNLIYDDLKVKAPYYDGLLSQRVTEIHQHQDTTIAKAISTNQTMIWQSLILEYGGFRLEKADRNHDLEWRGDLCLCQKCQKKHIKHGL